ncbi:MAG: peroxiredoxin, partial [Bacilli bacterium]
MDYLDIKLTGSDLQEHTLRDFKQTIVLYFYPKDNTPGCTSEAIDFSASKEEFEKHNTIIIGVSKDSIKSHLNFINKQDLNIL